MIYPSKMVIFHSYVSLPEGIRFFEVPNPLEGVFQSWLHPQSDIPHPRLAESIMAEAAGSWNSGEESNIAMENG